MSMWLDPFPDWAKQTNSGNFSQVDFDAEGKGFVEPEWNRWNRGFANLELGIYYKLTLIICN